MRLLRVNFRRIFVTGILIVLPTLVTYFLLSFLFDKVNANVTPHLKKTLGLIPGYQGIASWVNPVLPVAALILILAAIFFVGLLGTNYLGRRLIEGFHTLMLRIPIVKGIYGSAKQLFDAFSLPGVRAFEEVCLIEYPRRGLYCLGFITRRAGGEIQQVVGKETVYIFLPTTPNPTSGYLLVVPRSEIHVLDMSIEEGIKLVVSGGMVYPNKRSAVPKRPGAAPAGGEAAAPSTHRGDLLPSPQEEQP